MTTNIERHDLEISNFATISGIRGKQFGREIFNTLIEFKDLMTFLEVFPEVQRDISMRRVNSIKKYVLSGLEDMNNPIAKRAMRFFSAITVTARGHIFYEESSHRLAIDTTKSKLSVNDGQHRFHGISEAIRYLQALYNREINEKHKEHILYNLNTLKEMVIPVVIFNGVDIPEEKQMFHDLNNLAQRPSRSATIRLAQTDLLSKLAREIAEENVYLKTFGVEMDKMSIHKNNKNLILLTTIHYCVNELIPTGEELLAPKTFDYHKKHISSIFDSIFEALPTDIDQKGLYLLEKNYAFKGIARFIVHAKKDKVADKRIYQAIKDTDWTNNLTNWSSYGASEGSTGVLFAGGEGGIKAVFECLYSKLNATSNTVLAGSVN
ncbi:DNA sulfur modification protein DndB [Brevibacillus sp. NPDC058079]|uniref:DNA sulfur modification protein DndB n=1 Tax=Brevibacillus sp. NPDC058079 TaxID=3346330 RepID=UPI0036ED3EF2